MVALGLARRQRAAKLRRLQKQELEKRATARLGAADGAVYVAAVSRFPGAGQPLGRGEAWSSTRASSEVPAPPAPAPASLWARARAAWLDSRTASRRLPRQIARSRAAGALAAIVVVALGFHGAVARLRDAPHLAAPDDARFDAYGRYVAAEAPETARSAFSPSLLMVAGSRKSGATYVRQLLLDNLYVAPLDARDHDHHLEPAMAAAREAAGVAGAANPPRDDPGALLEGVLRPGSAAARSTLVVFVAKDPYAWVASSARRPHPDDGKVRGGSRESEAHVKHLLHARARAARGALALRDSLAADGAAVEVVAYEDALRDPEALVARLAAAYGLGRRRGGHLQLTHHLTNDAGGAPGAAPSLQRRARLASSGLFVRKAYYLDRDYVADLGRNAHHAIRTHLDAAAEAALGLHDGVGDSRRDARRARRRKRHVVALLRTLDKLVMPVVGGCLALLLGVSAFVFWRLRGEEPASDGAAETPEPRPPSRDTRRPPELPPPPTAADLAIDRARRAQRDELRWVTDRGARAVPAARKDVAAAAAPPVSSYAAMWGEPDFNTADDSTDSDEEEFDVLDDPSSESSDSDFYD